MKLSSQKFLSVKPVFKNRESAQSREGLTAKIISSHKINGLSDDMITFNKKSNIQEFQEILASCQVKVIEVKDKLNRIVPRQVIIGADLIEMEYNLTNLGQVVICEIGDSVLEAVCKRRNIEVWIPPEK